MFYHHYLFSSSLHRYYLLGVNVFFLSFFFSWLINQEISCWSWYKLSQNTGLNIIWDFWIFFLLEEVSVLYIACGKDRDLNIYNSKGRLCFSLWAFTDVEYSHSRHMVRLTCLLFQVRFCLVACLAHKTWMQALCITSRQKCWVLEHDMPYSLVYDSVVVEASVKVIPS